MQARRASKRRRLALGAGLLMVAMISATASGAADLPANLRLPGLRGGELTSRELTRGNHVLVVWAGWSPRCRDIVERVNAISSRWSGSATVSTIDFQEDPSAVEQFLRGKSLGAPVYLDHDGEFSKALEITTLPGLVVIRDGQVRYQGRLPSDPDSTLQDLLR